MDNQRRAGDLHDRCPNEIIEDSFAGCGSGSSGFPPLNGDNGRSLRPHCIQGIIQ